MPITRCMNCNGSGKLMGGGMIMIDCDTCFGKGKISDGKVTIDDIKNTDSYRDAVQSIRAMNPVLTKDQAEKLFDDEFQNQEEDNSDIKCKSQRKRIEIQKGKDEFTTKEEDKSVVQIRKRRTRIEMESKL